MSFTISEPPPFTEVISELNMANTILNARGIVTSDGRLGPGGVTELQ
jgi:hypothetical protein